MKNTFKNILIIYSLLILLGVSVSAQSGTTQYVYDENGRLTHFFGPSVEPLGNEITEAVKK